MPTDSIAPRTSSEGAESPSFPCVCCALLPVVSFQRVVCGWPLLRVTPQRAALTTRSLASRPRLRRACHFTRDVGRLGVESKPLPQPLACAVRSDAVGDVLHRTNFLGEGL